MEQLEDNLKKAKQRYYYYKTKFNDITTTGYQKKYEQSKADVESIERKIKIFELTKKKEDKELLFMKTFEKISRQPGFSRDNGYWIYAGNTFEATLESLKISYSEGLDLLTSLLNSRKMEIVETSMGNIGFCGRSPLGHYKSNQWRVNFNY